MHDHPPAESIRTILSHGKKSRAYPYSFRLLSFLMFEVWLSMIDLCIHRTKTRGFIQKILPFTGRDRFPLALPGRPYFWRANNRKSGNTRKIDKKEGSLVLMSRFVWKIKYPHPHCTLAAWRQGVKWTARIPLNETRGCRQLYRGDFQ